MWRLLAYLFAMLTSGTALAAEPLTLKEVLASSAQHSPQIVEALIRVRQADARLTSARGAFDIVFDADSQVRPLGQDDGSYVEGRVTRPLETNGGGLYGGYRLSRGDLPIYEDRYFTNEAGDLILGGYFSLLRDRYIDSRRAQVAIAQRDIDIADFERQLIALGVQRRAIAAYQNWVASGQRVRTFRELIGLATSRQTQIDRTIELGSRAEIVGAENQQNVVRRQVLLVRSEQELAQAANDLSFFLRDAEGTPVTPGDDRLPAAFPDFKVPLVGPDTIRAIERPDLDGITARVEQAETRLMLARNDLRPRLDVRGEVSQSLGERGEGGPSRDGIRSYFGLRFSVPLEQRSARGRIAEAQAEIEVQNVRRRLIEDQILVEVKGLAVAVNAAERLRGLARDETALAERLAAAERRRFALGAADLIVVNLREEAAADARLRQLDVELRRAAARAELVAATVDRRQLGLEPRE